VGPIGTSRRQTYAWIGNVGLEVVVGFCCFRLGGYVGRCFWIAFAGFDPMLLSVRN